MYTVKEIHQALLACTSVLEFLKLQRVIAYLCRTTDYNEEQRFAIEAALLVRKRSFKFKK